VYKNKKMKSWIRNTKRSRPSTIPRPPTALRPGPVLPAARVVRPASMCVPKVTGDVRKDLQSRQALMDVSVGRKPHAFRADECRPVHPTTWPMPHRYVVKVDAQGPHPRPQVVQAPPRRLVSRNDLRGNKGIGRRLSVDNDQATNTR
jgi:hypothetical protein